MPDHTGKGLFKCRRAGGEGTDANTRETLDTICLVINHLPRGFVADTQSFGRTVRHTMAAVRTAIIIPDYAYAGEVDGNVEGFYELYALLDFFFRPGYVQNQIAFFLGSNLRTIHIDYEIMVFD